MNEELEKIKETEYKYFRDRFMIMKQENRIVGSGQMVKDFISDLVDHAFQSGRASVVSEIREKKPKKKDPNVYNDVNPEVYGFNQYSDEIDKILEGMEE